MDYNDANVLTNAIHVLPDMQYNECDVNNLTDCWLHPEGPEFAYLKALIEQLSERYCVNMKMMFSTGFSAGGEMTTGLACFFPGLMRAVAPVSGALNGFSVDDFAGYCEEPIPVLIASGANDGLYWLDQNPNDTNYKSLSQYQQFMMGLNGCSEQSSGWNDVANCTEQQNCTQGYPLVSCITPGLAHALAGNTGQAVWTFFSSLM